MIKLTDQEVELVIDELQLDVDRETTKALTKMFYSYYYQLEEREQKRDIYDRMFYPVESEHCPAIYHSPVNSSCTCCEDVRDE
jgi:hypothetical protein